jgi:UDP-N-acetylmuramate dehydrogenase
VIVDSKIKDQLTAWLNQSSFGGTVASSVPLAPFTSYGIGGPAALLISVPTIDDLIKLKNTLAEFKLPELVLGAGTNILFSDDGFDGIVIRLVGSFEKFEIMDSTFICGSSVPVTRIVREGGRIGFAEIVRLTGIPGWIGGGIVMNAGTFGEYIEEILTSVDILTVDNKHITLPPDQCKFGYRTSRFLHSGEIILNCALSGTIGNPSDVSYEIQQRLERRKNSQPIEFPSCGCVFANPPGDMPAARLIQEAGLKGEHRGSAAISEKHANFIINEGGASANDILELMALVRNRIRKIYGIDLLPEVQAYGFPAPLEVMLDEIDKRSDPDSNT